jgi:hypothetical protein
VPATYDLTGHALLSSAAAALSPEELDARTMEAEELLHFRDTAFGDDALVALARQVNRLLQIEGKQGVVSMAKGGQSVSFGSGGIPQIDFVAMRISRRLRGVRPGTGGSASVPTVTAWD